MTLDPTKLAGVREPAAYRVWGANECWWVVETLAAARGLVGRSKRPIEPLYTEADLAAAQSEAARWRELLGKVFDSRAPDYVDQAYPGWSTEARSALSTQTQGGGEHAL